MRGCMFFSSQDFQHLKVKLILIFTCEIFMTGYTFGWTYHFSNDTMDWKNARKWCQDNYTDLVAIQNAEENDYLNKTIPHSKSYYWLGIRKINDNWTWIGTNKTFKDVNFSNWAKNEPNNKENNQDCVEIYIKREKEGGQWNDEKCEGPKHALCFKAQCNVTTCSNRGECSETFNNFICKCSQGFNGSECQDVINCERPKTPQHGWMDCQGPHGNYSYNSTCTFHCAEGFSLQGQPKMTCNVNKENNTGHWTGSPPFCKGVVCKVLTEPENGHMNCTASSTTRTLNCEFSCSMGFLLLGPKKITCRSPGGWTGMNPICAYFSHVAAAVAGACILSTSCYIIFCCVLSRKRKKMIHTRTPEEDNSQIGDIHEDGTL